ncbi:MAG: hypothetical protein LBD91_01690, partial [Prevotellaceae bacterium]|nr:hypothetical protein [Prevotellaceae bacterium]
MNDFAAYGEWAGITYKGRLSLLILCRTVKSWYEFNKANMRRYWFAYYLLVWIPTAGAQPLQDSLAHIGRPVDSLRVLHEVVVVGQQTPAEIIPVQTMSGEALQRLSAHSVADALR